MNSLIYNRSWQKSKRNGKGEILCNVLSVYIFVDVKELGEKGGLQ